MADLIQPGGVWRPMQGFRFGLQQRSMLGTVAVDRRAVPGLPGLEQTLAGFVDEPLPPRHPGHGDEERLVHLFAFAYAAILRSARIAASDPFHLQRQRPHADGQDVFDLCIPVPSFEAWPIAVEWARNVCNGLVHAPRDGHMEALGAERENVLDRLRPYSVAGVNPFCIRLAAYRLRVPVSQFDRSVLQLGTGKYARWMDSSITDATPSIGVHMAGQKHDTARVLLAAGLPGGVHELVASPAEAVASAARLGYPVVVKPADQEKGAGVSADLRNEQAVLAAWDVARAASAKVLVERWAPGLTHRLTVYNGHVIRASRRIAGGVTGDGASTIAELVSLGRQTGAQRRAQRLAAERALSLDDEALGLLEQEGLSPSHIPASGTRVRLRRRDNVSAGGTNEQVSLDQVHPDNLQLARDAARLLRLDFAGVDLIIRDISASWLETGALICEVNAQPQMAARAEPELWNRVVAELVGPCSRVPARLLIVADDAARERNVAERIARESSATAVSARPGLWIAGRRATLAFESGFKAAQALLRRTDVESAACLMTLGELERTGLPLDQWDSIESVIQPQPGSAQAQRLRAVMAMTRAHVRVGATERMS